MCYVRIYTRWKSSTIFARVCAKLFSTLVNIWVVEKYKTRCQNFQNFSQLLPKKSFQNFRKLTQQKSAFFDDIITATCNCINSALFMNHNPCLEVIFITSLHVNFFYWQKEMSIKQWQNDSTFNFRVSVWEIFTQLYRYTLILVTPFRAYERRRFSTLFLHPRIRDFIPFILARYIKTTILNNSNNNSRPWHLQTSDKRQNDDVWRFQCHLPIV